MRRVCFFNSAQAWGGGEKWHLDVAQRLHARGWPVLVVGNPGSELCQRASAQGLPVRQCRVSNLSFLQPFKIFTLARLLTAHNIDNIILNLSADVKAGGLAAKLAGVPHIIYRRGLDRPIRPTALNRWLFTQVITHILVNSESLRRMFLETQPYIPPQRISVVYNGLDLTAFDQSDAPPLYAKQRPDELVLGNVGRLVEQKGQTYLIELMQELARRNLPATLLIAGSGPRERELREYARARGVAERVRFVGFVEQIRRVLDSVDIFLLTSLYEGFGYVLAEAMAAGKPTLAFRVSSNPEIVEHGRTGFLVAVGDVGALADHVETLYADERLRQTFGARGRQRVEEHFTIERTLDQVSALLNSGGTRHEHPATAVGHDDYAE